MSVLAIGAHPDDLEFRCARTLDRCAERGDKVIMVTGTIPELVLHEAPLVGLSEWLTEHPAWLGSPAVYFMVNAGGRIDELPRTDSNYAFV